MTAQEWLDWRHHGVGGSDVGVVMQLHPYMSRLELFHQKIGYIHLPTAENERMFWGKRHESTIAKVWQFYDGKLLPNGKVDMTGAILNMNAGTIVRKSRKVNGYVQNPDYPAFFSSVDRLINKGQVKIFTGDVNEEEGLLECKTISANYSRMFEDGIPPSYVAQMLSYMMVFEIGYSELAVLKDGNSFEVFAFERGEQEENAITNIRTQVDEFWERVMEARNLVPEIKEAQLAGNDVALRTSLKLLQDLEPEPDGTEALATYLSSAYKAVDNETVKGNLDHLAAAIAVNEANKKIKEVDEVKTLNQNILRTALGNATVLDLGENGIVTWNENTKGTRTLRINLKKK